MQFSFAKGRFAACCLLLGAACAAAGFALGAALSARPSAGKAPAPSVRLLPAAVSQPSPPQSQPLPQRLVCLTFDDGPSRTTPAVLEALAAEGVPATFFVVASESNESYLPLVQQAQQAGHEIALHSASHKYSDIYRSADAFWADIELLRQRLAPYVDAEELRCLRFPGGSTNTVSHKYGGSGIMQQLKEQAEQQGLRWVDWNVCAEDATGQKLSADAVCRNVTEGSQGLDRCVVLMHDSATTATTAQALPAIIRWYKENGYTFCTVSQLYGRTG